MMMMMSGINGRPADECPGTISSQMDNVKWQEDKARRNCGVS